MSNVKKLPDSYAKGIESNNYKLLNLNEQAIADAKADAQAVFEALDLQNATWHTLDLYGDMLQQKRGTLNDEQYRMLILRKIGINVAQGNYPTVINILKQIFNCEANEIILGDGVKPCTVDLKKFPLEVLTNAGFSSSQAVAMIEILLPIGVTIDNANFEGTFEFAETANEYDESAGFANDQQTIGGYLGLLFGDDDNGLILPI